jgi:hypothetical protein
MNQCEHGQLARVCEICELKAQRDALLVAAIFTLRDNLHLCDGDVCTLMVLRETVAALKPNWEVQ